MPMLTPGSCFGRYLSCKRPKGAGPSTELLLIWHGWHKRYGLVLISGSFCISHLSSQWDRSLCGQSQKKAVCERNDWSEARWVFCFLTGSFREASEVIHGKTEVKILILLNQWDFWQWHQGNKDFFLRYFEKKDCILTQQHYLLYLHLLLLIYTSWEPDPLYHRERRFILLSACIVAHQPEPVLGIKRGL